MRDSDGFALYSSLTPTMAYHYTINWMFMTNYMDVKHTVFYGNFYSLSCYSASICQQTDRTTALD